MRLPGSSSASSAFPMKLLGRLSRSFPRTRFSTEGSRGCSYFVMFKPPSLLASQIVPTAAGLPSGQPRRLRPSRTCVVTFTRIGYAIHLTTGNWWSEDSHLARFATLSAAPTSPPASRPFPVWTGGSVLRAGRRHTTKTYCVDVCTVCRRLSPRSVRKNRSFCLGWS